MAAAQQTMGQDFEVEIPKKTVSETFGKSGTGLATLDQLIDVLQQWQQFYELFPRADKEKLLPVLEIALPMLRSSTEEAHRAFALLHAHYGGETTTSAMDVLELVGRKASQ